MNKAGFTTASLNTAEEYYNYPGALLLMVNIDNYDPGNAAARAFVGYGAGACALDVSAYLYQRRAIDRFVARKRLFDNDLGKNRQKAERQYHQTRPANHAKPAAAACLSAAGGPASSGLSAANAGLSAICRPAASGQFTAK